ncbi:MAG: hypothetical protein ACFFD4_28205 [Candidatus Odinarchaeota archaeon]
MTPRIDKAGRLAGILSLPFRTLLRAIPPLKLLQEEIIATISELPLFLP